MQPKRHQGMLEMRIAKLEEVRHLNVRLIDETHLDFVQVLVFSSL
jgi:hypothetical protein